MMIDAIDLKQEILITKKKQTLDFKEIKSFAMYNYINQQKPNIIIDCIMYSKSYEKSIPNLFGSIPITSDLRKLNIEENTRLIIILLKDQSIKDDENLQELRNFIQSEIKIKEVHIF